MEKPSGFARVFPQGFLAEAGATFSNMKFQGAEAAGFLKQGMIDVQEKNLVGGLEHFLFFHILGRIMPID